MWKFAACANSCVCAVDGLVVLGELTLEVAMDTVSVDACVQARSGMCWHELLHSSNITIIVSRYDAASYRGQICMSSSSMC